VKKNALRLICALSLSVLLYGTVFADEIAPDFVIQAENDYLALYLNEQSAAAAVLVKASGSIWYSNPIDWENDRRVGGINREFIQSQIRITYYNEAAQEFTMNSYFDAVSREQFEIERLNDGFKITYFLGDTGDRLIVPHVISKERLDIFRENMTERDWAAVMRRYLDEGDVFTLREAQGDFALGQLHDTLQAAGYTRDDMDYDHDMNHVYDLEAGIHFDIPLVYRLDGPSLLAYIPTSGISYPADFPLARITMLEFFGAAGLDANGYILVPDGSGSLIYLNNGRTTDQQFVAWVYGRDWTFGTDMLPPQPEPVRMPVFGLMRDGKAMFATIEDGDAFAILNTRVSGIVNSYNSVWADFRSLPFGYLQLEHMGDNQLQLFQDNIFEGAFKIRYAFLDGDAANYSGMAKLYQDYLVERGLLTRKQNRDELPFVMDSLGAIQRTKNFMGIPYQGTVPLTTFAEAVSLLESLRNNGIKHLVLKYSGWLNGGMHQYAPTSFKIVSQLGGEREFKRLIEYVNKEDIPFYPELNINYVYSPAMSFIRGLFGGFTSSRHAARSLGNTVMRRTNYHIVTNFSPAFSPGTTIEPAPFIVNPAFFGRMTESFLNRFNRFGATGLATGDLFSELNSAFNRGSTVDRQRTIDKTTAAQEQMLGAGYRQLSNGANAYAFKGIDYIVNVPFDHNGFMVANEAVPFYQMVVRGFIEYTGSPMNTAADLRQHLLGTLETGSGVYVQWMYEQNSIIRESFFTRFYSHNYERSFRRAVDMYHEAAAVLNAVQNCRIVRHEILPPGLRRVTYENGVAIWLNYTDQPLTYGSVTVGPQDYFVEGGI
jgi:hypothetical protein